MNPVLGGGAAVVAPVALLASQLLAGPALAAESNADLALQLSNPVAAIART